MKRIGAAAIGCYVVHGSYHLWHGHPDQLLWACSLAAVIIGIGIIVSAPGWVAVGVCWLLVGTPLWLIELASGDVFLPTSLLTHGVALAIGLWAIRRAGWPRGTWWKATAMLVALQQLTFWTTPAADNVNLAFRPWGGAARWFHSYPPYYVVVMTSMGCAFVAIEFVARGRAA